jgi:hypothetical protein
MHSNREDADKCLRIARDALREGNPAKAERFAEKAARLFPSAEARAWGRSLACASLCVQPAWGTSGRAVQAKEGPALYK